MNKDELAVRARKFLHTSYPRCLGFPKCDGDLLGEAHADECPAKNFKPVKPVEIMANFALSELSAAEQAARKEERELCCKDVCEGCAKGIKFVDYAPNKLHQSHIGDVFVCKAASIRNRE